MKINIQCNECTKIGGGESVIVRVPINDIGHYKFSCIEGHSIEMHFKQTQFELLAEIAVQAIADGYYIEAVTSFASSLERFYQFYVEAVWLKHATDGRTTWKLVEASSERQIGLFIGVYAQEKGKVPDILKRAEIEFRNRVIHKGYIPTEAETLKFCQRVIEVVDALIYDLFGELRGCLNENHEVSGSIGKAPLLAVSMYPNFVYQNGLRCTQQVTHLKTMVRTRAMANIELERRRIKVRPTISA